MDFKTIILLIIGSAIFLYLLSLLNNFVGGNMFGLVGSMASFGIVILVGGLFFFLYATGQAQQEHFSH